MLIRKILAMLVLVTLAGSACANRTSTAGGAGSGQGTSCQGVYVPPLRHRASI